MNKIVFSKYEGLGNDFILPPREAGFPRHQQVDHERVDEPFAPLPVSADDPLIGEVIGEEVVAELVSQGEPAPAGYRIVAGSAPGLNDLGSLAVGLVTSFSASVPPGRYHVSLTTLDACGTGSSGLSQPVTVVVP